MRDALRRHWPEYLMEAALLGAFMISAAGFTTLLFHPASPVPGAVPDPLARRALMGLAMGSTAAALIYSRWGRRSGAHLNPSVSLAFLRLGRMHRHDAAWYVAFHLAGAAGGMLVAGLLFGGRLADPAVHYVATVPGRFGQAAAFLAELAISALMMLVVLTVSGRPRLARFTGLFAGGLVALYIALESPVSGMSMNPARTLGPALFGRVWDGLWIYLTAPPLGMLAAAEAYRRISRRSAAPPCAKLQHDDSIRCIHCIRREERLREERLREERLGDAARCARSGAARDPSRAA